MGDSVNNKRKTAIAGVLSAATRKRLPKSKFGLPGQRKYPMPDRSHAGNAKARAKQMLNKGKLSQTAYNAIVALANKKLGTKNKPTKAS